MITSEWLTGQRDQILIVKDPGDLSRFARGRYPHFDVRTSPTYLSGIAAMSDRRTRGLLVGVDPTVRKLDCAIAGLRKAAGATSRLVLCCPPSGEPLARDMLTAGADDYLIYPPNGEELDHALDLPTPGAQPGDVTPTETAPTWDELTSLASILSGLDTSSHGTLERVCQLIADSMRSPLVRIATPHDKAFVGDPNIEPTLTESITSAGRNLGQILIGPRQRDPFSGAEVEKLRHYTRLIAHVLDAAEQQQRWQSLAMIDEVTQLPNRRYLMQALDNLIQRAVRERSRLTLLIFDLDGFKHFNDTYGHAAGDQVIRETGQLFRQHCRQHDIVARYAGDEFVVVFWDAEEPRTPGSDHPRDLLAVLRRFQKSLGSHRFPMLGPEATGCITISGGLATFPWDARDAETLIARADQAMLQAKRAGKNRIYLVGSDGVTAEPAAESAEPDEAETKTVSESPTY